MQAGRSFRRLQVRSIGWRLLAVLMVGALLVACGDSEQEEAALQSDADDTSATVSGGESSTTTSTTESTTTTETSEANTDPELVAMVPVDGVIQRLALDADEVWLAGEDLYGVDRNTHELFATHEIEEYVSEIALIPNNDVARFALVSGGGFGANEAGIFGHQGELVATIDTPTDSPWSVAIESSRVWIGDGDLASMMTVAGLDGEVLDIVPGPVYALKAQPHKDSVWALGHENAKLWEFDPDTFERMQEIVLDAEPQRWPLTVVEGGGYLWAGPTSEPSFFYRVNTATGEVVPAPFGTGSARTMAFGDGSLWIPVVGDGLVLQIDPETLETVREIEVDGLPTAATADDGTLYVVVVDDIDQAAGSSDETEEVAQNSTLHVYALPSGG